MRMLCLAAHPDDEILWFWPYVLTKPNGFSLVVCSSDENNPDRKWCKARKQALVDVCELLQIRHYCLPHPSEFSKLPHRGKDGRLNEVADDIVRAIMDINPTEILTHNPHGEYGHQDHRFVHQLVIEHFQGEVFFTDIYQKINWPLGPAQRVLSQHRGYVREVGRYKMDYAQRKLYEQCKSIYEKHGCWTWSQDVVDECSIYRITT